jgi:hypothetical protein
MVSEVGIILPTLFSVTDMIVVTIGYIYTNVGSVMSVSKEMEKLISKVGLIRKCYSAYQTKFVRNKKVYRLPGIG